MKLTVRALLICVVCSIIVPTALSQKHHPQPTANTINNPRAPQNKTWRITGIKVKGYDQSTGDLAELSLEETLSTSANAPFGPVLVIVEVTGELEAGSGKSIALNAMEGRRTVFRGTFGPGPYQGTSEGGKKFYAPFWISSNVLCDPLKITARVVGQRQASTMTKTVKFLCGE
ncbi:MAG: hypothetical protein QOH25_4052 [Acidobacteriota bacterium]|jgi:hypothetical protein|nr:hypothetical protein [Acidobacteriota bacterium]